MVSTLTPHEEECHVRAGPAALEGNLSVPPSAKGVVLFAHGSGSSRHSPRNRYVAWALREAGLATLLLDLLTPQEESRDARTGRYRFDIDLLAQRLEGATDWLATNEWTGRLPVGYFGASTGAGAALTAAGKRPEVVSAIVSRGGRPDLAGAWLASVRAPTLLIVGGKDWPVIGLNQTALEKLGCPVKRMNLVPGATHLFEEDEALEAVARVAADWFMRHLSTESRTRHPRRRPR